MDIIESTSYISIHTDTQSQLEKNKKRPKRTILLEVAIPMQVLHSSIHSVLKLYSFFFSIMVVYPLRIYATLLRGKTKSIV